MVVWPTTVQRGVWEPGVPCRFTCCRLQLGRLARPPRHAHARLHMQVGTVEASQFTYWLNSPPPPPGTDTSPSSSQTGAETIAAPEFYNTSIPDAPPGLTWWEYLPDVPPLADPVTLLGPAYAR